MTNYRVLIFDDDDAIRSMLWNFFDSRGYEVFTFPTPKACPLCIHESCQCGLDNTCSDIILTDLEMPYMEGISLLENQIEKGCKCRNFALMSGNLDKDSMEKAQRKNIKVFSKPFTLTELGVWIKEAEQKIDPERRLADWFLESRP